MINEQILKRITQEDAIVQLSERYEFISKARRALPRIKKKMIEYPNWKSTCPKSDCELTLEIIKEELQAYLEEAEDEVNQLNRHIAGLVKPKSVKPLCTQGKLI